MTVEKLNVTVLVDNKANQGLVAEHGFSLWIETENLHILFDTGQGPALPANADKLGIDLERADILILSHGHYDHTGGIAHVLQRNTRIGIYCHPAVVQARYSIRSGPAKTIQMPEEAMAALEKLSSSKIHWISEPRLLSRDMGLTGPIPRNTIYEDPGGPFFLDPQGNCKDPIEDDSALWINTPQGLVVCVGCSHSGIVNTLDQVRRLSGVSTIRAVIGGFHLLQAGEQRIQQTLAALQAFAPQWVVPCHCTGDQVVQTFKAVLGDRVVPGYAGWTGRFGPSEEKCD